MRGLRPRRGPPVSFISLGHLRLALPFAMAHLMEDFRI